MFKRTFGQLSPRFLIKCYIIAGIFSYAEISQNLVNHVDPEMAWANNPHFLIPLVIWCFIWYPFGIAFCNRLMWHIRGGNESSATGIWLAILVFFKYVFWYGFGIVFGPIEFYLLCRGKMNW